MKAFSSDAISAAVLKAAADTGVELSSADSTESETAASTEKEESGQSILKFDATIIWSIVNIIILFVLLRIFLFKPVNKLMEERTAAIQKDIDEAKKSREEAEALKAECKESVADARNQAQDIVAKAREEAASEKQEIIQQSQDEASRIIDAASITIENERKRSIQDAQAQLADLAIVAASKIIGENVDDEKNRRLVDKFLAEEGAVGNDAE